MNRKRESPWAWALELGVGSSVFLCAWGCKISCNQCNHATGKVQMRVTMRDALCEGNATEPHLYVTDCKSSLCLGDDGCQQAHTTFERGFR